MRADKAARTKTVEILILPRLRGMTTEDTYRGQALTEARRNLPAGRLVPSLNQQQSCHKQDDENDAGYNSFARQPFLAVSEALKYYNR